MNMHTHSDTKKRVQMRPTNSKVWQMHNHLTGRLRAELQEVWPWRSPVARVCLHPQGNNSKTTPVMWMKLQQPEGGMLGMEISHKATQPPEPGSTQPWLYKA